MFCKNCGAELAAAEAVMCVKCGTAKGQGNNFCQNCGQATPAGAAVCLNCGVSTQTAAVGAKSKMVAGLLAIFLGTFGVHNFYLGYTKKAVLQLVCSIVGLVLSCLIVPALVTCGIGIWAFIEGIMIFMGKIDRDANGNLLAD